MTQVSWKEAIVIFICCFICRRSLLKMFSLVEMAIFHKTASYIKTCFAERGGFEPPNRFRRLHAFQACLFSHSSTFPYYWWCKSKTFILNSDGIRQKVLLFHTAHPLKWLYSFNNAVIINWKCLLFMIESTLPHLLRAVL